MSETKSKPILPPPVELWKSDSPAAKATDAIVAIGYTPDNNWHASIKCPDCDPTIMSPEKCEPRTGRGRQ